MSRAITVTGTREVTSEPDAGLGAVFAAYLLPFTTSSSTVHLGGAAGIDTAALDWLAAHTGAALIVVVPCTVADQPEVAATAVRRWQRRGRLAGVVELGARRPGTGAFHARNRWMVDRSDLVIGFPRGDDPSSGTRYTLGHAARLGLPHLVVPV
ncbi:hypothetical protein GCM10009613_29910 [Pseudonocardia kongjuensis]|uniref:Smf/DprA SLOG domain-containing protein n=1 Tax=Pseudonocardia kongjuensis TaxID=102227 RepID=A0ABN1XU79_9PSEU